MRKTVNRRLDDLENAHTGGGFYMVRLDRHDGLYHFMRGDDRVMNEKEFKAWERSKDENDFLIMIKYRDDTKEKNDTEKAS
jgi:heme/copper-type cytochrome/quinol oxidase subunit 2